MVFLPASLLALIYAFPLSSRAADSSSSSGTYSLSSDITKVIPSCAQTCFISFLDANFPKSLCSTAPSLECLCTRNSTSGFTAGEGAVQCIIAEDNVQFCQGSEAGSAAVSTAFNMCSGFSNALPNTHPTLTATLIIQTASPSIVQVAPTPTTLITSRSIANSPTSTAIPTTEAIIAPTASRATSSTFSSSPTASADQQQTTGAAGAAAKLNTGQIAGIAVAGVGVVALAAGIIAVAVCLRRRRQRQYERDSDLLPFGFDTGKGNGFKGPAGKKLEFYAPGPTRNGVAAKIGPPGGPARSGTPVVPPRVITNPNMFSRRSLQPEEIGVAISPEKARHASKLLPEKPVLKLHVPAESVSRRGPPPLSFPMPPIGNAAYHDPSRDSAMTQFEEDGTTPYTPYYGELNEALYEDYGRKSNEAMIPPSMTYNWATGLNQRDDDQAVIRPLEIKKPVQSFSQPLRPTTTSSSVYSTHPSYAGNYAGYQHAGWQPQRPQQNQYTPYGQQSRDVESWQSSDTVTDIESIGEEQQVPRKSHVSERTADLSPVVESPVAVSPVSYPKIPKLSPTLPFPHAQIPVYPSQPQQPSRKLEYEPPRARWAPTENGSPKPKASAQSQAQINREQRERQVQRDEFSRSPPHPVRSDSSMSHNSSKSNSSSLHDRRRKGEKAAPQLTISPATKKVGWQKLPSPQVNHSFNSGLSPDWKPQNPTQQPSKIFGTLDDVPNSPRQWTPKKVGDDLFLYVE